MSQKRIRPELEFREGAFFDPRLDDVYSIFHEMRGEFKHYATKAKLAEMEPWVSKMEPGLTRWIVTTALGSVALAVSVGFVEMRLLS